MKQMSETIVFFGSGPVAAASLRLLAGFCTIEAVVTKPRPAHHRGPVPVLEVAEELSLKVSTAENKKQLDELFSAKPFASRVAVLIDFGILVSQQVIDYFPLGIVNSHFSLLPEWRGADPITFSILSGQKTTGVSLMLLVEAMDEGPLLGYGEYALPPGITTPELTKDLIQLSYQLLETILPAYCNGSIILSDQSVTGRTASYSRKLTKEDGVIDWHKPAEQIERDIRAYSEWPKSRARLGSIEVIITAVHTTSTGNAAAPGTAEIVGKELVIRCGRQALVIDRLTPAGKKEMSGQAFLSGYKSQIL
ncbi:MAG TPA: methionyl-tRNA formyltransferase [Candidatus Saccharimonadales bacterium]|nr:methionyl-tRNA formyltransferase [Candidatus Saccharimonadales bacterium]